MRALSSRADSRSRPNGFSMITRRQAPSASHWFGTDTLARDVFSRVILGAREILNLSGSGTLLAVVAGTAIGLITAYRRGWLD